MSEYLLEQTKIMYVVLHEQTLEILMWAVYENKEKAQASADFYNQTYEIKNAKVFNIPVLLNESIK